MCTGEMLALMHILGMSARMSICTVLASHHIQLLPLLTSHPQWGG